MKGLLASQTPQGRLGTTHERCSRKTHRNLATKTDEEMDLAVGEGLFWPSLFKYSSSKCHVRVGTKLPSSRLSCSFHPIH